MVVRYLLNKPLKLSSGIYIIENLISHRVYIGSALDFRKRCNLHISLLSNSVHSNTYLQHAWNKYGKTNFSFWILEEVVARGRLIQREQYYFDMFQNFEFGMYNICQVAGRPTGIKLSKEARIKLGLKKKGNKNLLGYKHTEEAKKKIGEKHKGKIVSLESRQKMSRAKLGVKRSLETCQKMRSAQRKRRLKENETDKSDTTG
jgi:group I intron endonuclease